MPKLAKLTRIPAIVIPIATAIIAFFFSIPSKCAAKAPEYAPVPGKGTPTNKAKPSNPYLSTYLLAFLSIFTSLFLNQGPKTGISCARSKTNGNTANKTGINSRLNAIHETITSSGLIPAAIPNGIDPRNSINGVTVITSIHKYGFIKRFKSGQYKNSSHAYSIKIRDSVT